MTITIPAIRAMGMLRPGSRTSPAAIGILFHPSYPQSAASIAVPNSANPLHSGVFAGVARFASVAVFEAKNTPPTTNAIPAIFRTVSKDCTFPPTTTVKQLMAVSNKITATATICLAPNCQLIVCPRNVKVFSAHTALSGKNVERKIAKPAPRLAIDALPATMKRCHPKRKAEASPYECRR